MKSQRAQAEENTESQYFEAMALVGARRGLTLEQSLEFAKQCVADQQRLRTAERIRQRVNRIPTAIKPAEST